MTLNGHSAGIGVNNEDEQIRRSSVFSAAAYIERANAELAMCEKCKELDAKIEHYRWLSASISDKQTLDGIKALIAGYEAQKKALHPEE